MPINKNLKTKKTMKSCTNCGATITCGCQERVASNGTTVCGNCISLYEQQLAQIKATINVTSNENTSS